jgi:PilZ domain
MTMGAKLERIFEFRVLHEKKHALQIPLTRQEAIRLERLGQELPMRVPALDDRDPFTQLTTPLQVQFVAAGRIGSGQLRHGSGAGFCIATPEPAELGHRVLVHVQEPVHGVEYTFPCRVVSRVVKGTTAMGVSFDGLPNQARIGTQSSGVWRSDLTPVEPHVTESLRAGSRRSRP